MFSNGKWAINVRTVGQLINELKLLPGDMPLLQGVEEDTGADIAIYNRADPKTRHIGFCEGGCWSEVYGDDAA